MKKYIADPYAKLPEQIMISREELQELYSAPEKLSAREQTYLLYRYGFTISPGKLAEALPEPVRNLNSFIVYRAGSEPIEKAKYSISWTLLLDTAKWFAARHKHYFPDKEQHLYCGTISADKVIAYLDDCGEFEIVQYRNVKNVEELPIHGASPECMNICEQKLLLMNFRKRSAPGKNSWRSLEETFSLVTFKVIIRFQTPFPDISPLHPLIH